MMELVVDGLKSVTVRAPDYETLMVCPLFFRCVSRRELMRGSAAHSSDEEAVSSSWAAPHARTDRRAQQALHRRIRGLQGRAEAQETLGARQGVQHALAVHGSQGSPGAFFPSSFWSARADLAMQIEQVKRPLWRSMILLLYRFGLFSAWGILALPGVILNGPIFIAAGIISRQKAKGLFRLSSIGTPLTLLCTQRLSRHRRSKSRATTSSPPGKSWSLSLELRRCTASTPGGLPALRSGTTSRGSTRSMRPSRRWPDFLSSVTRRSSLARSGWTCTSASFIVFELSLAMS